MIVMPCVVCLVSNGLIFYHVHASSRRVQTGAVPNEGQRRPVSQRDLHLLRHMIIMFAVSVTGWAPTSISRILEKYISVSQLITESLIGWYGLALLFNVVDLFLYNHEVRRYLIDRVRQIRIGQRTNTLS